MAETPWWGVPVLSGAFALAAVAVAQIVVVALDGRRLRRENQQRWDSERRQAYVQFLHRARQRVYEDRGKNEAGDELVAALAEVQLLASAAVSGAASDLYQFVIKLESPAGDDAAWDAAKLHSAFMDAARGELGIVMSSRKVVLDADSAFGLFLGAAKVAFSAFVDGMSSVFGMQIERSRLDKSGQP